MTLNISQIGIGHAIQGLAADTVTAEPTSGASLTGNFDTVSLQQTSIGNSTYFSNLSTDRARGFQYWFPAFDPRYNFQSLNNRVDPNRRCYGRFRARGGPSLSAGRGHSACASEPSMYKSASLVRTLTPRV